MTVDFPRFVLFDLDGTLIDGIEDLVCAINVILASARVEPLSRSNLEPMLGDGMRTLVQRAFAYRGIKLEQPDHEQAYTRFIQAYQATNFKDTRLFPGARTVLESLNNSGWHLGLASNKLSAPCQKILGNLGVADLFSAIVGCDMAPAQKPAGAHLQYTLERMGAQPHTAGVAVMVGDHSNDVAAARQAGIAVIAVAFDGNTQRAARLGADSHASSFTELYMQLNRLTPTSSLYQVK